MTKKIVALLPMKANSSRVKGKNFREFCGKPLFRWILDSLLAVEEIDEIIINTDARNILAENGLVDTDRIRIRDRKSEICGDDVSMNLVLADDVANVEADMYLMTHTTNPLLSPLTISKAIKEFAAGRAQRDIDSLFTVNKIQTRFYRQDCSPINHDPDNLIPTQNLEPWYEENSNLYIFTRVSFAKTQARIGKQPMMMETPAMESSDIDTPDDWDRAIVTTHYFIQKGLIKP
jgi:CMP-N-acetylneuraminic acid synthetase